MIKKRKKKVKIKLFGISLITIIFSFGFLFRNNIHNFIVKKTLPFYDIESIPEYSGKSYIILNKNELSYLCKKRKIE